MIVDTKVKTTLEKINKCVFPIEYECNLEKNKYALFNGDSFASGNLGLVLFHYYYHKVTKDDRSEERALEILQNIVDRVDTDSSSLSNYTLSYGLSGLGIVLDHLSTQGFISYENEESIEMDQLIYEWAHEMIHEEDSEFLHGAMGAISYLSKNQDKEFNQKYIKVLLEALSAKAIHTESGSIYFDLFNKMVPEYPKDTINLSLSHGLCGIILVLLELLKRGADEPSVKPLIQKALQFLEEHITPVDFSNKIYCYSDIVIFSTYKEKRNTRLAWCYGDINMALVFLTAGKLFNDAHYTEIGNKIGITTLSRKDFDQTFIKDSQFCHGAAGMTQVYYRFHKLTGNPKYLEGRDYWLQKTIDMVELEIDSNYYDTKGNTGELLEGLTGVGLVLLSAIAEEELTWDNLLILS
ncbi:lantibiotic modifying enzyme [Pedobacter cryoconitis]|uniref:Lantibiotic modifying enzyme n=1 Tax=Pedobacter cryoconitis TaxID=188932 RepID=A0A7W8YTW9_9SPHI|nr:lanthionine synthetase C family protein [Pedobacter cryoconitis]MBB5621617.1 lantibiotic modifying enzyme [Pedobacter cryoconitis]